MSAFSRSFWDSYVQAFMCLLHMLQDSLLLHVKLGCEPASLRVRSSWLRIYHICHCVASLLLTWSEFMETVYIVISFIFDFLSS